MNILQINKFYFLNGGSEQYMFSLADLLIENGHGVVPFSMKNPRNCRSEFETFFIKQVDYNCVPPNMLKKMYLAFRTIYSLESKSKLNNLLNKRKIDLAHLHNFSYHLTPSILAPLNERSIPVVQTLHDYHIICPNHNLYDFMRKQVCEDCQGKYFNQAINRKCIKGSLLKSLIGAAEGYVAKYLDIYGSKIQRFISPSRFLRDKIVAHGVCADKIVHIPNFVNTDHFKPCFKGSDYFVYFGRMEEFKGLRTLIKAFSTVRKAKLYLLGTGSLLNHFKEQAGKNGLNNVHFLGFKQGAELKKIISNSLCTICPSEWYENNPICVLESFALGKAVIGSTQGGIPELVKDSVNGLLFAAGDASELAKKIEYCLAHPNHVEQMGREARQSAETTYNPQNHYRSIIGLYKELNPCL